MEGGGGRGAELEHLIRKAKVQHDTIERGHTWMGDHYTLSSAPAPRFLRNQIMCRFYQKIFWE